MPRRWHARTDLISAVTGLAVVLAGCSAPAAAPPAAAPAAPTVAAAAPTSAPAAPTTAPAKPAAQTTAASNVTLQWPSWQEDEPGISDWYKSMIAEFEKASPTNKIALTKVPLADFVDKLTTQFAGGAPPQIVQLPNANVKQFIGHAWLHPLDDYLKNTDIEKLWPRELQDSSCKIDGKTYCLMLNTYGDAWVYNEQLLKAANQPVPTTPEQYLAAVKAMTDPTKQQFGTCFPTQPGFNMVNMMSDFVIGAGGSWTTDGKPSANTPKVVQGLTWWNEVINAKAIPLGNESGACRQLLQAGKVGSYFDGPWGQGFMAQAAPDVKPNLKAVAVPFPQNLGGAGFVIGIAEGIPDDQQALAWTFISSLTTPQAQGQYAYNYGSAPLREDAVLPGDMKTKFPFLDVWIGASKKPVSWTPIGLEAKQNEFIKAVSEAGQAMISQGVPPQEAADRLQQQLLTLAGS